MRNPPKIIGNGLFLLVMMLSLLGVRSWAFTFGDYEAEEQAREQAQARTQEQRIRHNLRTPCPSSVKDSRIMVVVTEVYKGGARYAHGRKYHPLFEDINTKLREQEFRTYSPEEIDNQIALAEQNAYLNNDLDAAIDAANKLGADYILKSNISTVSRKNPILHIDEVFVHMQFQLQDVHGRGISSVSSKADSFAGADTISVAEELVRTRAGSIVGRLYRDLCTFASGKH